MVEIRLLNSTQPWLHNLNKGMSIRTFLLFAGAVVIYLLILFLSGRRKRPSSLRFIAENKDLKVVADRTASIDEVNDAVKKQVRNESSHSDNKTEQSASKSSRSLNVFFNFNGETFEAFEILGIPAGSSIDSARAHYEKFFSALSRGERAIYESALDAIVRVK